MRIGTSTIDSRIDSGSSRIDGLGSDSESQGKVRSGNTGDTVQLSEARNLIQLAKTSTSAAQVQHLDAVRAQVGAGQYETDFGQLSHALVNGHLES
jgi:hypothetical protein